MRILITMLMGVILAGSGDVAANALKDGAPDATANVIQAPATPKPDPSPQPDPKPEPAQLKILPEKLPPASVRADYPADLTLEGGIEATWQVSGLPPGIVLKQNSLVGKPTKEGVYTVAITATTASGKSVSRTDEVTVHPAGYIRVKNSWDSVEKGKKFEKRLKITEALGPVTLKLTYPERMAGGATMVVEGDEVVFTSTPDWDGERSFYATLSDPSGRLGYVSIQVAVLDGPIGLIDLVLPPAVAGLDYKGRLRFRGPSRGCKVVADGLPKGLEIQDGWNAIVLAGRASSVGTSIVVLTVSFEGVELFVADVEMTVLAEGTPQISTSHLAPVAVGAEIALPLLVTVTDARERKWTVVSGALPDGVTVQEAAYLQCLKGKPAKTGRYQFRLRVTTEKNLYDERDFTWDVVEGPAFLGAPLRGKVLFMVSTQFEMAHGLNKIVVGELERVLDALPDDTEFDIVGYGTKVNAETCIAGTFKGAWAKLNAETRKQAKEWIKGDTLRPVGGADLSKALDWAHRTYSGGNCQLVLVESPPRAGGGGRGDSGHARATATLDKFKSAVDAKWTCSLIFANPTGVWYLSEMARAVESGPYFVALK